MCDLYTATDNGLSTDEGLSTNQLRVLLLLAVCRRWCGELHGVEGQQLAWVSVRQLQDYAMPAADIPLVQPVLDAMQEGSRPAS
jgi:hypothetical protein